MYKYEYNLYFVLVVYDKELSTSTVQVALALCVPTGYYSQASLFLPLLPSVAAWAFFVSLRCAANFRTELFMGARSSLSIILF